MGPGDAAPTLMGHLPSSAGISSRLLLVGAAPAGATVTAHSRKSRAASSACTTSTGGGGRRRLHRPLPQPAALPGLVQCVEQRARRGSGAVDRGIVRRQRGRELLGHLGVAEPAAAVEEQHHRPWADRDDSGRWRWATAGSRHRQQVSCSGLATTRCAAGSTAGGGAGAAATRTSSGGATPGGSRRGWSATPQVHQANLLRRPPGGRRRAGPLHRRPCRDGEQGPEVSSLRCARRRIRAVRYRLKKRISSSNNQQGKSRPEI